VGKRESWVGRGGAEGVALGGHWDSSSCLSSLGMAGRDAGKGASSSIHRRVLHPPEHPPAQRGAGTRGHGHRWPRWGRSTAGPSRWGQATSLPPTSSSHPALGREGVRHPRAARERGEPCHPPWVRGVGGAGGVGVLPPPAWAKRLVAPQQRSERDQGVLTHLPGEKVGAGCREQGRTRGSCRGRRGARLPEQLGCGPNSQKAARVGVSVLPCPPLRRSLQAPEGLTWVLGCFFSLFIFFF